MTNLTNNLVQCWGCGIFDRLFNVVSVAGANIYDKMVLWAWVILIAFWAFYTLWVVWQYLEGKTQNDWLYQDSVKPVLINSFIVLVLLGMGVQFPKLISSLTFEPAVHVASVYTEGVLQTNPEIVEEKVAYSPAIISDDGFFRPELRDKIIHLMKVAITQFQTMINLGFIVMDNAFSVSALLGIGALLKHILMFVMGAYLVFQFFKLFIKFCFYFVDVIVALAMFAFFFPMMLVFFVFKNSKAATWVQNMFGGFASKLFENVFNSIAALGVAVITYTVVMVIIAKFFASDAMSSNEIAGHILDGTITPDLLSNDNLLNLTLFGCIVIGFLVNYLTDQIPAIGKDIYAAFGVKPEAKLGEEIGTAALTIAKNVAEGAAKAVGIATGIVKPEEKKPESE